MAQAYIQNCIQATVDGDEVLDDIEATLSARMVMADYGVPGSPRWAEPEDERIEWPIRMFSRDWSKTELVARFGQQGADAIMEEILDLSTDAEWSADD